MQRLKKGAAIAAACAMCLSACANGTDTETTTKEPAQTTTAQQETEPVKDPTDSSTPEETTAEPITEEPATDPADPTKFIDLALNVYYNDADHNYYQNEVGPSVRIYNEGQYTVTFDCASDLSDDAIAKGVDSLVNLTAIYVKDAGVDDGEQSPLKGAKIMYDSFIVDGQELTITLTEPKNAFKGNGIFDTNDPVNAWEGSCIEQTTMDSSSHVANFTGLENPKKAELTFTLSDMTWEEEQETPSQPDQPSEGDFVNTAKYSDMDFTNMSALELSVLMGNGINLGNTMEAYGRATMGTAAAVSSYETYWGQPLTTAAMIQGMKNCGFDTLRVPIAWTNAMNYETGDYTIGEKYMNRIQEIVDYAIEAEMFVIINDHWDGGWWAKFGSSEQEDVDAAFEMYKSMWTQICERFKDYGDMVIFESGNEEHGDALNNNSNYDKSGYLTEDGIYEMANKINQTFVDVVRASGGNNDDRFLLIAGYNTDIDRTCDSRYKMPTDTADHKLFLSVHYYTPWNYCGVDKNARWGIKQDYELIEEQFSKLKKFTDEGYGVIIGEYAALPYWEDNTSHIKDNTTEFTKAVLDMCDQYNLVPMLWSCNDLYLKRQFTMATEELNELYTSRCYMKEQEAGGFAQASAASFQEDKNNASEMWDDVPVVEAGKPYAWIMWNGGAGTYSVGDTYNPADNTAGAKATDVLTDGAGTYTVSLEFPGGNTGLTFAALAVNSGEEHYPGCIIDIKEITYDGVPVELIAKPYTSSDDKVTTRVNLINGWVNKLPKDARCADGDLTDCAPVILDSKDIVDIKNITITFELIIPE
ncbi:MAG: glycoside hydrolase family 5 protein [Lachnospiraceae bacterium]|nr:glycoside hydrolase family 5 protein [Lachnospiraceae bacterium]